MKNLGSKIRGKFCERFAISNWLVLILYFNISYIKKDYFKSIRKHNFESIRNYIDDDDNLCNLC